MINLKKVMLIFSIGLVLFIANISNAKVAGNDFSGEWCWDKDSKISAFAIGIFIKYQIFIKVIMVLLHRVEIK